LSAVSVQNVIRRVVPEVPILTKCRLAPLRRPPQRPEPHILQLRWRLCQAVEAPNAALHHIRLPARGRIQLRRPDVSPGRLRPPLRRNRQVTGQVRRLPIPITVNLNERAPRSRISPARSRSQRFIPGTVPKQVDRVAGLKAGYPNLQQRPPGLLRT